MTVPEPSPVVKVARDLTEILALHDALTAQAVAHANDRLMPGGMAMVALGPVADPEVYERRIEVAEAGELAGLRSLDLSHLAEEDDAWEPPLQTLRFWSEERRERYGYPLEDRTPTVATEAGFLRWALDAMWRDEPRWEDFADDMHDARMRLENLLHAGVRDELGVPCMYDECKGKRIRRKVVRYAGKWVHTPWRCPSCEREWSEDQYARMVTAAHVAAQREDVDGRLWVSLHEAARELGRSIKTLRTWVNRGELAVACIVRGRRQGFVALDEVRDRDEKARKKRAA